MTYEYGDFTQEQVAATKEKMRKQIFFLLLIVDPKTSCEFDDIDVDKIFVSTMSRFGGMNKLLGYPQEFVTVMSLLEAAYQEYKGDNFNFWRYRKYILDAGNEVKKIKEVS